MVAFKQFNRIMYDDDDDEESAGGRWSTGQREFECAGDLNIFYISSSWRARCRKKKDDGGGSGDNGPGRNQLPRQVSGEKFYVSS